MSDDEFEDVPRKKKKKAILSVKQIVLLLAVLVVFVAGAVFQHYYVEPVIGEGLSEKVDQCLSQKEVLDERFVACDASLNDVNNLARACEFQLDQCLEPIIP